MNPAKIKVTDTVAEPTAMVRGSATGLFNMVKGEVQGNPNSIADTGKVALVIDAASYKTESQSRDKDVKENALEVENFPTPTFQGDGLPEIQKDGDRSAKQRLLGKLTLHGVTKNTVLPLTAHIEQGRFIAAGTYTFGFEQYGVKRPSTRMGLMVTGGDEATIALHVVADPV